jgi:hypothetical protein
MFLKIRKGFLNNKKSEVLDLHIVLNKGPAFGVDFLF